MKKKRRTSKELTFGEKIRQRMMLPHRRRADPQVPHAKENYPTQPHEMRDDYVDSQKPSPKIEAFPNLNFGGTDPYPYQHNGYPPPSGGYPESAFPSGRESLRGSDPASTQGEPRRSLSGQEHPDRSSDHALREYVLEALASEKNVDIIELQVNVESGLVILDGQVRKPETINILDAGIRRMPGVRALLNKLRVSDAFFEKDCLE